MYDDNSARVSDLDDPEVDSLGNPNDIHALDDWETRDYILEDSERSVRRCIGLKIDQSKYGRARKALGPKRAHRVQRRK